MSRRDDDSNDSNATQCHRLCAAVQLSRQDDVAEEGAASLLPIFSELFRSRLAFDLQSCILKRGQLGVIIVVGAVVCKGADWSMPMAAPTDLQCDHNVHAVFTRAVVALFLGEGCKGGTVK